MDAKNQSSSFVKQTTCDDLYSKMPDFTIKFDGATMNIPSKEYLTNTTDTNGKVQCYSSKIQKGGANPNQRVSYPKFVKEQYVLGSLLLENFLTVFDQGKMRIGISLKADHGNSGLTGNGLSAGIIVLIVAGSLVVVAGIAFGIRHFLKKRNSGAAHDYNAVAENNN